jgi:outer membrane protein OmpA-like peptidoglycan-associated protein
MTKKLCVLTILLSFTLAACTTDPYTGERKISDTGKGAGIGAAAGAAIGALTGGARGKRALYGAAAGALVGTAVGVYMDRQESKLRSQLQRSGVSVTRQGDNIILNMPGNVTFDVDSADINARFYEVLDAVALTINEFDKTYVDITGHTDSTGSDAYNLELSQRRADSVAQYLVSRKVDSRRIFAEGRGEQYPIASNNTEVGRAQNRRVEITLQPITS